MKRFMAKAEYKNYKVISFTSKGKELADKVLFLISDGEFVRGDIEVDFSLDDFVKDSFRQGNVLIFVGAAGIAVRAIAPYIEDKTKDPAVIVIDEEGRNVIPLLSGHIGGGVREAKKITELLGANLVVTTASDVSGEFAVDVFASENGFAISDMKKAKEFTARLLEEKEAVYEVDAEIAGMPSYDVDTGYANVVRQSADGECYGSDAKDTDNAEIDESEKETDIEKSKACFTISFRKDKSESGA